MTNLQQEFYEDDNGNPIPAADIRALGSYVHASGGFYNWTCGRCGSEHHNRWYNISGRVMKCSGCHQLILLVRTNCKEVTEVLTMKWESDRQVKEAKDLIGIRKFNSEEVHEIASIILNAVQTATNTAVGAYIRKMANSEPLPDSGWVRCKFCSSSYLAKSNPCSNDCLSTSCPHCSSCQANDATPEFVAGALARSAIKYGKLVEKVNW